MINRSTIYGIITVSLFLFMATACSNSSSSSATGSVSIGLTDAASDDYNAIYVTIDEVQVHTGDDEGGDWHVVATPGRTFNLLELVNGVIEQLGTATLETGQYTQVRLIAGKKADAELNILNEKHPFANYIVDSTNTYHELKIPSGYQTGIKLIHAFEITEGLTTELVLDFDADQSVVIAGSSGNWLLKPTIKVVDTIENAIVDGVITDEDDYQLAGVLISAQVYDADTGRISVHTSTLTDEYGGYLMYLEPGTYSIVAYKDGYSPACSALAVVNNEDYEVSLILSEATMETIACTVTTTEEAVTIQFLQESPCEPSKQIAVKSVQVTLGGPYNVDLPAGTYRIVAFDGITLLQVPAAATGSPVELDLTAE
jgi:hypothetical protein